MILDDLQEEKLQGANSAHRWFFESCILFIILAFPFSWGFHTASYSIIIFDTFYVITLFSIFIKFGVLFLTCAGIYFLLNNSLKKKLHLGVSKFHFVVSLIISFGIILIVLNTSPGSPDDFANYEFNKTLNDLIVIGLLFLFACQCIFILNIIQSILISILKKENYDTR